MTLSVHDNLLYAHVVDADAGRIVLHTAFPDRPSEFTDVVFEGVTVYHFEGHGFGGRGPTNILFDVAEDDPRHLLEQYADLLARSKNYGWPLLDYQDIDELIRQLTADGGRCFAVSASFGMIGFVFARSMTFRTRPARAMVGG